jgi:hypothetical protein
MGRLDHDAVIKGLQNILEYLDEQQLGLAAIHVETALQALQPMDIDLSKELHILQ